jgi:pimeloyl-ACP methyl ester carboxylesterase
MAQDINPQFYHKYEKLSSTIPHWRLEQLVRESRPLSMSRLKSWLSLLALLSGILACNLPTSAPASIATPSLPAVTGAALLTPSFVPSTPTAHLVYQPVFEPAPCAFPVPSGYSPECGDLVVPENRARSDTPFIRLHVGIFRNHSGSLNPDPVVKLSGGPGTSGLNLTGYLFSQGLDAVLATRDLVIFDQRGVGYSRPRLDCSERHEVTPLLLRGRLSTEESQQAIMDAFRRCRERLIMEGIDLSAYNSVASAADLNDLRLALGYEKLNLYAVSYGTRLALTLMRDHPEAVRSAVLDSAYPLQVNLYTSLASNADRAFNVLFNNCAADPGCNAAYPDLRSVFYALVDQLNAQPVWVSLLADGGEQSVLLDGGLLIDVLFVGLYNPAVTASMPRMIYDIRGGEYGILRDRLALYFDASGALGMQMAVQCTEEIRFNTVEDAYAAAQGVQPQIAAFYPASVRPLFAVCGDWATTPLDPRENAPVTSDLPALILAGEDDPITPPDWGRMVDADLTNAYFHEFPGHGHWVTRSSRCALQMALAFWDSPTVDPGFACQ